MLEMAPTWKSAHQNELDVSPISATLSRSHHRCPGTCRGGPCGVILPGLQLFQTLLWGSGPSWTQATASRPRLDDTGRSLERNDVLPAEFFVGVS